jgi:hypothetical protein
MQVLVGCQRTTERRHVLAIAIAVIVGLSISMSAPGVAHAAGCTDSWTNASGGSWFTGTNWSTGKAPGSEDEACITTSGTYTVAMTQTNLTGTVSVRSLTIGASSGTQTLVVGSSCSVNAILTTTAGLGNGARGAIVLTNGDGCGSNVTLSSAVTNAGTLAVEQANGGSRTLQGNLTNTGTLTINANTAYSGPSTLLGNEGAIDVAEGKQLAASGGASITNGTGGKIVATGSGDVSLTSGTFTEGAGTTSGSKPVIVDDGTLQYSPGGGASLIALRGTSSLGGTSSSGQSLSLESTCSENTVATASSGFTNGGTVTLTNGDGCGDNVTLAMTSPTTLANSGTIAVEAAHGGSRQIQGNLTNTGTVTIGANTADNGASTALENEGAIDVAEGKQLTVATKDSLTNGKGGSIVATGNGNVLASSGASFTEGAGTTSGTEPVIVDDGTLNYTGAGASRIVVRGTSSLTGSISSEQSLAIQSTCSENTTLTAAASFTNGGTITLTNGDGCGDNVTLVTTSPATLSNSGKIVTETAHGGSRQIQGNLTNTGTLAFGSFVAYNGSGAALNNEGAIEIGEAKQVTVSNTGSFTNGAGGSITVAKGGDLLMSSGTTFNEGAGTTSGGQPVIVDDGTLNYTGAGASQIALRGSSALAGSLSAEQLLSIQSTCSENVLATIATSLTNAGTIILTNGDGCGDSATITTAGTLTNSGKIVTEPAHGGARAIQGDLTNTGTLVLNANTSASATGATLLNEGTIDIVNGVTFSVSGSATFVNGGGGLIDATGSGALVETGGTFEQGLGASTGSEPVILDDATLTYIDHGSGPIALRGTSTLGGGNIKVGETLRLESTCSENATITAASFTNNGTLELTNADGCSDNVTLNLKGGTLTNTSTIDIDNPHGGLRAIQGNLVNAQFLVLAAGETLQVSGNYTQTALGKFKTSIASTSSFGALSATGLATIAGKLILHEIAPFHGELGQKFALLTSSSLTGAFAAESEGRLNTSGLYYEPTYSPSGVTLLVAQATLSVSPESGLPGSSATVSGSGFLPGDTLEVKFSDHHAVKTIYPTVTVNGSGEFSTEITIPPTAALHSGEVKITSVQTGAKISKAFIVT